MMKNVIDYFSITTKPKVTIFDDKALAFNYRDHSHRPILVYSIL